MKCRNCRCEMIEDGLCGACENNAATKPEPTGEETLRSSDGVAARALDAPNGEGRWLANMHGTWQEFEVRKEEARFVMPGYGWHPIKWYIENGWGRWQAVAARSATKEIAKE
jgi:hypothetical protein